MSQHIHVVGARPNFIKAAPVVSALREAGSDPLLVHTGQHYDERLSKIFFEELELPVPDYDLGVGSGTHGQQTAALLAELEPLFSAIDPVRIVVYGDINSTLAAALVAAKMHIPVAHVEAGLRSFDRTMPEEVNRVVTDQLSDLHFTTSPEASTNLELEGIEDSSVHFVGNSMIDTLTAFRQRLDPAAARHAHDLPERYGVCTLHRPANVDDPDVSKRILAAVAEVGAMSPLILPLHPRGRATLEELGLGEIAGLRVTEPLGYVEFMSLLAGSSIVLTDSGGIQEETTVLGVPCLTLRDNTERPITVTEGTNRLVGTDPDLIVSEAKSVLESPPAGSLPALWDGRAGKRIAEILMRLG